MPQLLHYLKVDDNTTTVLIPNANTKTQAAVVSTPNAEQEDIEPLPGSALAQNTGLITNRYDKVSE